MSKQKTFENMGDATFLPGSVDGSSPCNSPDDPKTGQSGQAPVPVNHSPRRAKAKVFLTSDTYGPLGSGSSQSADLTRSLGSRLQAQLATVGSIEYSQTWRGKVTPAGRPYWAHTASARRTSGSGSTGWPTPQKGDGDRGGQAKRAIENRHAKRMNDYALLAGWSSPRANKWGFPDSHGSKEAPAGWPTPQALSFDKSHQPGMNAGMAKTIGFLASTEKRGALNPAFSRWLMGFPPEWDDCAVTAMQSFPKSRRRS